MLNINIELNFLNYAMNGSFKIQYKYSYYICYKTSYMKYLTLEEI